MKMPENGTVFLAVDLRTQIVIAFPASLFAMSIPT